MAGGIVPWNALSSRNKFSGRKKNTSNQFEITSGWPRHITWDYLLSTWKLPSSVGMVPVKLFWAKLRYCKFVNQPNSDGIVALMMLFDRSRNAKPNESAINSQWVTSKQLNAKRHSKLGLPISVKLPMSGLNADDIEVFEIRSVSGTNKFIACQ